MTTDTRRDSLSSYKICRFCLAQGDSLTSIYQKRATKNIIHLPLKILSCVSIEVFPSDKMPTYICSRCKFFMELCYDFKHVCRQADEQILQYVQNATPLSAISWPQSLVKIFRLANNNKIAEVPLMKAVIDGGTTVQVTAQESDSDEEDDENVYNVKIGDGTDDGPNSARVKVVTGADKQEKAKQKRGGKGFHTSQKLAKHVQSHSDNRSFPCKYCSKSFVKSHHYTRHLRLKHRETIRTCRGPFGESDQYRCEQCEDSFATQDELIYHSAIHATQNLTCPLCQEKFEDVDGVTTHIKSHVSGTEYMCELCELVFTSKIKLNTHMHVAHDEELRSVPELGQDESSTEMDVDEEDDDSTINVKELGDHMVVEIKKTDEFLISNPQEEMEYKTEATNSEESENDTLPDLSTAVAIVSKPTKDAEPVSISTLGGATITKTTAAPKTDKVDNQHNTANILRKVEEMKKKAVPSPPPPEPKKNTVTVAEKKTVNKTENGNTGAGTSDKSLRMLEKDLQELKRTHPPKEAVKTPAKPIDTLRNRRAQIHTSTPKVRTPTDERKTQVVSKSPVPEKKIPERRVLTKENKEPKEIKENKANNGNAKEEKEVKDKDAKEKLAKEKEVKEKEAKEKEKDVKQKEAKEGTPKNVVKNGGEKPSSEEGIRRSTRPSKIKDYAKMIRDRSQDSDENDDSDDADDEEYKEVEKPVDPKSKARRASIKTAALKTAISATPTPRKRGRPRKDAVPPKVRKEEVEDDEAEGSDSEKDKSKPAPEPEPEPAPAAEKERDSKTPVEPETSKTPDPKPQSTLVSPTGQTLKKIPIRALPPGVKPMPLPVNARPMGGGEVCEMQIGKKVVKVQKIVMTKAEVEAMAKKGLVEMKDGTMVLKQGIKIPTTDPSALKSSLVGEAEPSTSKESPIKKEKSAVPTRCDFGEDT
ncbi:unnamed protein product [Spodoptera littoralis]|uniref:Uncharacterized protein n=1 Tax=Spodoptera littoralis TaxID=7109 RepID=A0A9P0I8I1_SPOLI|nr:unnamed protein product [Spodoptera littoralis]CAH1643432.1 unnamed protein product [Spodoptera littoralis]